MVGRALDQLVDLIIETGHGEQLPAQDQLAKQLGVSRTVLREAMSKLEFLNVVLVRPKTGTIINPPAEWKTRNDDVIDWQQRAYKEHKA
jgi:DNA-binding FadR family transcriptional regulator